jgi:monofunctional biosynthetic peptidoglycan transglycosylase
MLIRVIENKTAGKDAILSHDWEPIENISLISKAVIASEDGSFRAQWV